MVPEVISNKMKIIRVLIFAAAIIGVWYIVNQSGKGFEFKGGKTFTVGDTISVEKETTLTDEQQKEIDSFNRGFDSINRGIRIGPVIKIN